MKSFLMATMLFLACVLPVVGQEFEPTLGKKGKQILDEKFEQAEAPKGWNKNTGSIAVDHGALVLGELAADKHAGAFRKTLPLKDFTIQLDFKLQGAKLFHVGFDPASGELKKKGHLYSLIITPTSWSIVEHSDKSDPNSKNVVRAKADTQFELGRSYTLLLENKGAQVAAQVQGKEPLRAKADDFAVKKPGLVFRVGGADDQHVLLDNVVVWELD